MGEAGGWLSAMAADDDLFGYRGLVLGGLGGGHVPAGGATAGRSFGPCRWSWPAA